MTTAFVSCPYCGTLIHPIASRCKYCRADVLLDDRRAAPVLAVPLATHVPSRAVWVAAGLGLVGAGLALAAWRFGATDASAAGTNEPATPSAPRVTPAVPPPAVVAPPKTPDRFAALVGRWRGVGDQPDVEMKWTVDLKLTALGSVGESVGTVTYGDTLDCSGELVRMEDEGEMLVLRERITVDRNGTCVAEGTIKLSPATTKLDAIWFYASGTQAATATLSR